MSNETKSLMSQLNAIVSLPSVSSAIPKLDTSNAEVIEFLANSFDSLGFSCEIIPCNTSNQKLNLIATYGTGPVRFGFVWSYGYCAIRRETMEI